MKHACLTLTATAAVALPIVVVLMHAPRVRAQATTPAAAFEVASVRPSNPAEGYINTSTPSINVGGERLLRFSQITLRDLIMLAYGVGAPQVQGPRFLNGTLDSPADRFDVSARVPAGATREQVPLMLRALLAERFHLATHRESKTLQTFALDVVKGGLKMKESPKEPVEGAPSEGRCTRSVKDDGTLAAVCTHMTTADIAQHVQTLAPGYFRDGPVVDASGLTGVYDFTLEWITAGAARNGDAGPSMFDAVQQQLGLKLERRKEQVEMLVIDKLNRTPEEN